MATWAVPGDCFAPAASGGGSVKTGMPTSKQEAFCRAYRACGDAAEAYRQAYAAGRLKPATVLRRARALLADPAVVLRLAELGGRISKVDRRWVIERLVENVERAMTKVPATDRKGQPTGVYSYQGAVANRALYLLGKTLGLFAEPVPSDDSEGGPLAPDAARDRLARRIARLFAEDDEDGADR